MNQTIENIFLHIFSVFLKIKKKNLDRLKCTKEEWAGKEGLKPIRKLSTLNRISDT